MTSGEIGRLEVLIRQLQGDVQNPPRFRAWRNAALSLASNGVFAWDQTDFDSHGWFNTSTGVYTPQRAGVYRLSWNVRANAAQAADFFWISIVRKNGTPHKVGQIVQQRGTTAVNAPSTALVEANGTTDNFDVIVQHATAGSIAMLVGAQSQCWFDGEWVGELVA